jgi:hypothetical protein
VGDVRPGRGAPGHRRDRQDRPVQREPAGPRRGRDETQALLLVLRHQAVPIRDGRVVQLAPAVDLDAATRRHMDSRIPAAAETHAGKHPGPNKK